jgi:hypothetical protein
MAVMHFKRSIAMFQLIAAAMALPVEAQMAAFNNIPEYKSRGKGRGTPSRNFLKPYATNWKDKLSGHTNGAREMARRVRAAV